MTKATIGSISHGTLRNEDLLEAMANELNRLTDGDAHELRLIDEASVIDPDCDEASEIICELENALNNYAPAFCYFGTHQGDGSDFGFWPDFSGIDMALHDGELVKVDDPANVPETGCALFVNDHGNMTVYVDGKIAFDCV